MENNAEAQRHFRSLSDSEKLDELWFGLREIHQLSRDMIERQDKTNGSVADTIKDLAAHLEVHKFEEREVAFIKRWGGRGTGAIGVLIAAATGIVVMADKLWG